ncbi:hypothetical protein BHE74_00021890 [Ensete ventricosum]|nr:hypothetical protein GW17_00006240 [Ensete ventricosum]RWW70431.1 hypothetical protein BHE74_00021890 [Ensete ventricosum]RZS23003.1 hypothetical protein BHM03_00055845 [Ensete ventricosum]
MRIACYWAVPSKSIGNRPSASISTIGGRFRSVLAEGGRKKKRKKKREKKMEKNLVPPCAALSRFPYAIRHLQVKNRLRDLSSAGDSFSPREEKERGDVMKVLNQAPLTDAEVEELVAEFLEIESKVCFAAEAQESLEQESLAQVEREVRAELAESLHGDAVVLILVSFLDSIVCVPSHAYDFFNVFLFIVGISCIK